MISISESYLGSGASTTGHITHQVNLIQMLNPSCENEQTS